MVVVCGTAAAIGGVIASATAWGTPPEVLDPRYVLEPFAAAPDIVTPTGCTHDEKGRLLVIESHTHQHSGTFSTTTHCFLHG